MLTLKEKIIESALSKGSHFEIWEKEVNKTEIGVETEVKSRTREYMLDHEFDYLDELIDLGYLKRLNKDESTFKLGSSEDDEFLLKIAYTFTEACGYITEYENDYYEVAKQQGIIAKEFLAKRNFRRK